MSYDNQYALELAVTLVGDSFGEIPQIVFGYLARKGSQQLSEVVRGCGQPPSLVKQALLILIQHNVAAAYTQHAEEDFRGETKRPDVFLYQAVMDRALQLMRRHKFIEHIRQEDGDAAELIIEQLVHNGRLSVQQVVAAAAGKLNKPLGEVQSKLCNTFIGLVQSRYIERAPPAGLPPPILEPHPNSVKRKGGAKAGTEEYAWEQARQVKVVEHNSYEKTRFKVPKDFMVEAMMDEGLSKVRDEEMADVVQDPDLDLKQVKDELNDEMEATPAKPAKRARIRAGTAVLEEAAAAAAPSSGSNKAVSAASAAASKAKKAEAVERILNPPKLLWRVNNEEFNIRFRHRACVELAQQRVDEDAATVVAAMLIGSRSEVEVDIYLKMPRSPKLSEDEIETNITKLVNAEQRPELTQDLRSIIRGLETMDMELVSFMGEMPQGSMYTVNMLRCVDVLRAKQLEGVVKERFGQPALRIMRMLQQQGQFEQKQVADLCMLPKELTRQLLYRMLHAGFVQLQDIPRTSDRSAAKTIFTWRYDMPTAVARVAMDLYKAAYNALTRLHFEIDKEKELMAIIDGAKETGRMEFSLTTAQRKAFTRLRSVTDILEASLGKLDDMIALFNDY